MPQQHINKQTEEGISERYALFLFARPAYNLPSVRRSAGSQNSLSITLLEYGSYRNRQKTLNLYIFSRKKYNFTPESVSMSTWLRYLYVMVAMR